MVEYQIICPLGFARKRDIVFVHRCRRLPLKNYSILSYNYQNNCQEKEHNCFFANDVEREREGVVCSPGMIAAMYSRRRN